MPTHRICTQKINEEGKTEFPAKADDNDPYEFIFLSADFSFQYRHRRIYRIYNKNSSL